MIWSLVLSSRFDDIEHVITASHTCKVTTCRVYCLLQWVHQHSSWWHHVQRRAYSTDSSITSHSIKSDDDVLRHVYFSESNDNPCYSATCPMACKSNDIQHWRAVWYSSKSDDDVCRRHVQRVYCRQTHTASCPFQRVQWRSPASRVQAASLFGIQLQWHHLVYASSSEFNGAPTAARVPSSRYKAETVLATMEGVKPAVSGQSQTTPYQWDFFLVLLL